MNPILKDRRFQLVLLLTLAVVTCSFASHVAVNVLGIRTSSAGRFLYGDRHAEPQAVMFGSSLAYDGLNWHEIAETEGLTIESWATAGSSPSEWQVHQQKSASARCAFVVLSPYDLNENWLCDFRAEVVPLGQTIQDLRKTSVSFGFYKRILSQYAMTAVRKVFPTVGRSDGVMAGTRDVLRGLLKPGQASAKDSPVFDPDGRRLHTDRLTDWSPGRVERRLALLRTASQGQQSFSGLKKLALTRLLEQASRQGSVVMVVMPVSPYYREEFLNAEVERAFEAELVEMQQICPEAEVIRLDEIPAFRGNEMFRDLVHLNSYGERIATSNLINRAELHLSKR